MNRLKVLVFAFIALGLWVFNLTTLSSALATRAVEQTSAPLLAASGAVAQRIEASRSAIQAAVLKLAASPALVQRSAPKEAPTPDRFTALRTAAFEGLTDPARATAYMVLINEQGTLMAFGNAEPTPAPEGFDVKAAAAGGAEGVLLDMNGTPCLFFSVPVIGLDKGELKAVGAVVLGEPLWGSYATVDALADSVNKDLNLNGLGLWMKGKLYGAAGKKESLEKAFKDAKPGQTSIVERGTVASMGPIKLPMFVGAANVLEVAARRDIPGTPFEVVALSSARPFMESLASAQKISLLLMLGLLAAGIVFTLLVSPAAAAEQDDEQPLPKRMGASPSTGAAPSGSTAAEPMTRAERVEPLPGMLPALGSSPVPEARPEDFTFPPLPQKTAPLPPPAEPVPAAFGGPIDDPFGAAGPAAQSQALTVETPIVAPLPSVGDDFDDQRTMAYPAHRLPSMGATTESQGSIDPFALAGGPAPDARSDYNPDATRVAAVPPELLKSARRDSGPMAALAAARPGTAASSVAAPRVQSVAPTAAGDEDQHFQETFRDYLSTRQKCGEPNDGMTYDKFSAKLRKNKEQLVAKYSCRSVRFQVYVKDGKAALKATPVKE